MAQTLNNLKSRVYSNANEANSIEYNFNYFGYKVKKMPEGFDKNKGKKILKMVNKILDFNLMNKNRKDKD